MCLQRTGDNDFIQTATWGTPNYSFLYVEHDSDAVPGLTTQSSEQVHFPFPNGPHTESLTTFH